MVCEAQRTSRAAAVRTPLRALSQSVAHYTTARFTTPAHSLQPGPQLRNKIFEMVLQDVCHLTCTLTLRGGQHLHVRWSLQSSSVRPLSRCAMLQLLWSELHQVTDLPSHAQSWWGKWVWLLQPAGGVKERERWSLRCLLPYAYPRSVSLLLVHHCESLNW